MALFINQSTYLPKYQPTHIPTFKPTQLPTKLSTNIPAYPSKNLTTYQQIHLPNNLPTRDNLPTYITKNQPTNQKSNLQTYLPTYLPTYQPINPPTYLTIVPAVVVAEEAQEVAEIQSPSLSEIKEGLI